MQTFTKFFFTAIGFIAFHIFTFASTSIPNSQSQPQTAIIEAVSDTVTTLINEPISFNVLQNDTGEEIYVNLALQPSYGSLAWSVNGDFTYTPNENHVGPDVLVYQIKDNEGNTESANVFITVEGTTDLPLQVNVFHECYEPGFYRLWVYVSGGTPPYESFIQYGDDLTNPAYQDYFFFDELFLNEIPTSMGFFVFVRDAENNTVLENHLFEIICHEDVINACIAETHLELTPIITCNEGEKAIEVIATGGSGEYSYSGHFLEYSGDAVIVEDSEGCQNILFYEEVPAYTCPIAIDDVVNGAYNAPFHLKPLLNDIGDDLTISDISGLKHGTIQWKPDQFLAYYPNEGFAGIDTLEYEITDPMGNSARAKILAVVPENDEVTIFWERDCTRAADEGVYEINFTVAGGKPPYVLDGDFLTSEYRGDEILSFTKADGDDFTITAIDKDNTAVIIEPELIPCTFLPHPTSDFTVFISCVEGEDYGILTALDPFGEPLQNDFEGNSHGDTIPNSSIYSAHFSEFLEIPFEEIVFCPPIAEDDLYHSHPSYLHLPLTFNPLLNDSGHGLKLVKVESPNYGNVEWWQADGTINYRPNTDFQGVETFDYTLEDIGGNQTSATITLIFAHPTQLKITYERDCFEVNNNEAENYTVNAFVSGGVPPYQVQVNEDAFFEMTENGGAFSFEVPNGEGFQIYAEDNGAVTHTAMVEELEVLPCNSLCDNLSLGVNLTCSLIDGTGVLNFGVIGANGNFIVNGNYDGDTLAYGEGYFVEIIDEQGCKISDTGGCDGSELQVQVERDCMNAEATGVYVLNVYITGGTPPFNISGSINETLEGLGSAFNIVTDGNPYEVTVIDAAGNEFYTEGGYFACLSGPRIEINSIEEIVNCTCDGSMIINLDDLSIPSSLTITGINGSWTDEEDNQNDMELNDTIPPNSFFVIDYLETNNGHYGIFIENAPYIIEGFTNNICSPETYSLEAIDDFANTHPGEPVSINILQNDSGTNLQVSSILVSPSCGEIVDINPETGDMVYVADADTNCTVDTFVYEVVDECGNLVEATVTVFIGQPQHDLIVQVEVDCTNIDDNYCDGLKDYVLNVLIAGGVPPFYISGSINDTLESVGTLFTIIENGQTYEISVVDGAGNEFYDTGGDIPCTIFGGCSENIVVEDIGNIFNCLCNGSFVLTFDNLSISSEICRIEGYWFDNQTGMDIIQVGDTIPTGAHFELYHILTENNRYCIEYEGDGIFGNTSDFCSTPCIEATTDITTTIPTESITFNVLENDTGQGIFIREITQQALCGQVEIVDAALGTVRYTPDIGCLLGVVNFEYEIEDTEGNRANGFVKVVIDREDNELVVGVEMDCSNNQTTGNYELIVSIAEGVAPFTISGSINTTLDGIGTANAIISDGNPFEVGVVDAEGHEFFYSGGEIACQTFGSQIEVHHIEQLGDCLCDGSFVVDLVELEIFGTIEGVNGFWLDEDGSQINLELGDTIPANHFFRISGTFGQGIRTGDVREHPQGNISHFCAPQPPPTPILNESESQTSICGAGNIVLSLEGGGEGTTYHWYLDAEGTVPANPSTGQIWENDEIVGARTVYVIATDENGCQSEPLAISTFHYHELEVINFEIEIDELCENYQVTFVITGGNEIYTVNGQVAFHIVTRPWQPIEEDYFFTIDDSPLIPNCEPVVISGSVDETDCCIGGTLEITPSFDCLITQTQDSIALLTYQATGGDGTYTFNGNPQNDTLQNGDIYQIEVIDGNGCTASIVDTVDCFFTSIENPNIHSSIPNIQLFPNPNNGNFTLSLESKQAEEVDIEILDITGRRLVKTRRHLKSSATFERQDLKLESGLYFIRVSGKDWTWTEKMVVE